MSLRYIPKSCQTSFQGSKIRFLAQKTWKKRLLFVLFPFLSPFFVENVEFDRGKCGIIPRPTSTHQPHFSTACRTMSETLSITSAKSFFQPSSVSSSSFFSRMRNFCTRLFAPSIVSSGISLWERREASWRSSSASAFRSSSMLLPVS